MASFDGASELRLAGCGLIVVVVMVVVVIAAVLAVVVGTSVQTKNGQSSVHAANKCVRRFLIFPIDRLENGGRLYCNLVEQSSITALELRCGFDVQLGTAA